MSTTAVEAIARQFGAAIEMLEKAILACPESLWSGHARRPEQEFWYLAYHTLFWLDYYLDESPAGFRPPAPYGLEEMDPAGVLPPRVYSQAELLAYLEHGRAKCRAAMLALTDESGARPSGFPRREGSVLELHVYALRHVQHHAAQLYLRLRQEEDAAPGWVSRSARTWQES